MRTTDRLLAAAICIAAVASGAPALAVGAHTHGNARLDVAIDGPVVTLHLDSPLDSLLGFERAPRNDAERERVRTMAKTLRSGSAFVPAAAARCRLERVELASPVLAPDLLGEPGAAPRGKAGDEHADLDGRFVYRCDNAAALDGIDVMLFDLFKPLRRIDVQVAGPKGQSAARLTSQSRRVRW